MTGIIFSQERSECPLLNSIYQAFPNLKPARKPVTKSLRMGKGGEGDEAGKTGKWISLVGNAHLCTELVLFGIPRSQTCSKNQRNMIASHRFKKTSWGITMEGRLQGVKKPVCKVWLSTVFLGIELAYCF